MQGRRRCCAAGFPAYGVICFSQRFQSVSVSSEDTLMAPGGPKCYLRRAGDGGKVFGCNAGGRAFSRKEVFQPHLPVRLPCYDLAPVTGFTLGRSLRSRPSGTPGSHGLTGGVYKARERIHRAMADARLLANPASRSRVADSDPN